jgi:hypothetical protein
VLNRAFRNWTTDLFNQLKANNMGAVGRSLGFPAHSF